MKKLILRLLCDDISFILLFILSAYYSRWAIYKILPAFFNATSPTDSLLIGLGIVLLFAYILLCAWSICKSIKYLDQATKATQLSQYELILQKLDNWKIVK